jgi:hypothetical protein
LGGKSGERGGECEVLGRITEDEAPELLVDDEGRLRCVTL